MADNLPDALYFQVPVGRMGTNVICLRCARMSESQTSVEELKAIVREELVVVSPDVGPSDAIRRRTGKIEGPLPVE